MVTVAWCFECWISKYTLVATCVYHVITLKSEAKSNGFASTLKELPEKLCADILGLRVD